MNLIVASGGTGGHIIPALAVALAWKEKGYKVIWFGRKDGLESKVAKENGIDLVHVDAYGFGSMRQLPRRLQLISESTYKAMRLLQEHEASCVFSTGSFASFPTAMASCLAEIPLVVHEQNTVVGLANRMLMPFASKVYLGMPVRSLPNNWLVGNPLLHKPKPSSGNHLLIFAGSQGSQFINYNLPKILADIKCDLPIIHIAGQNKDEVVKRYKSYDLNVEVHEFVHNMDEIFQKTKIVLCRSGAMSLAEVTAYQIPAILIPYSHAKGDHQRKNAQHIVSLNGAIMVEEKIELLHSTLSELINSPRKWSDMKISLQNRPYQDASEIIVKGIIDICAHSLPH